MEPICFVATTPFAVNAFLVGHLNALSEFAEVYLCVDLNQYPLSEALDHRVRVINVEIRRKISPWRDFLALIRLFRVFGSKKFVSVHSITPKAGLLAMLAAALARVPHRGHTFTGQVWANRVGLRRFVFKNVDRLIAAMATRVFADSKSQCEFLEQEHVVPGGRISVLGHGSVCGVDLERFRPSLESRVEMRRSLGVAQDCGVFLFVGRLVLDKGIIDLCQAFARLFEEFRNVELWMVGPDEDGLGAALRDETAYASLPIRWLGSTFEPEKYMAAADLLVLPSYREGFGMVIVEAAACGIPAIASRILGVTDAVVDGVTGILVTPGNIPELSDAMAALIADISRRTSFGGRAMTRAQGEFSKTLVTGAWVTYYRCLLRDDKTYHLKT